MRSNVVVAGAAGLVSVLLMVLCLWTWQNAGEFFAGASRPYVATMAARES